MDSLHLKLGAPSADRRVVEEPVGNLSRDHDPREPVLELVRGRGWVGEAEESDEEPENAFLTVEERLQSSDPLKLYVRQIGDGRLLTVAEERELARRKDLGDEDAKRRLIECNLRLVM